MAALEPIYSVEKMPFFDAHQRLFRLFNGSDDVFAGGGYCDFWYGLDGFWLEDPAAVFEVVAFGLDLEQRVVNPHLHKISWVSGVGW